MIQKTTKIEEWTTTEIAIDYHRESPDALKGDEVWFLKEELLLAFQSLCYCGFLKKHDAPISLCIHCKTLSELVDKGYLQWGELEQIGRSSLKATRSKGVANNIIINFQNKNVPSKQDVKDEPISGIVTNLRAVPFGKEAEESFLPKTRSERNIASSASYNCHNCGKKQESSICNECLEKAEKEGLERW